MAPQSHRKNYCASCHSRMALIKKMRKQPVLPNGRALWASDPTKTSWRTRRHLVFSPTSIRVRLQSNSLRIGKKGKLSKCARMKKRWNPFRRNHFYFKWGCYNVCFSVCRDAFSFIRAYCPTLLGSTLCVDVKLAYAL